MNEALLLRIGSVRELKAGVEPDHVTSNLDNESDSSIMSEHSDALPSIVHSILNLLRVNICKSLEKTELSVKISLEAIQPAHLFENRSIGTQSRINTRVIILKLSASSSSPTLKLCSCLAKKQSRHGSLQALVGRLPPEKQTQALSFCHKLAIATGWLSYITSLYSPSYKWNAYTAAQLELC